MDIELAKQEISAAKERIAEDHEFIRKTQYDMAIHLCPFSIGDEIVYPQGEKEVVASISYCSWSRAGYDLKVFKFKKNGDPYKQSTHAYGDLSKYTKAAE